MTRRALALCCVLLTAMSAHVAGQDQSSSLTEAARALARSDYAAATRHYQALLNEEADDPDSARALTAMIGLGRVYQATGQYDPAIMMLESSVARADRLGLTVEAIRARQALGSALTFSRGLARPMLDRPADIDRARAYLLEALTLAEAEEDADLRAAVHDSLATLDAAQARTQSPQARQSIYERALEHHRKSIALSVTPAQRARMQANAAVTAEVAEQTDSARRWIDAVLETSDPHVDVLVTAGHVALRLGDEPDRQRAMQAGSQAIEAARSLHDDRGQSYALGLLAELYEQADQLDDALTLSRKALFHAQQTRRDQLIYRSQWQSGRLLRRLGRTNDALATYLRAAETLGRIRSEITAGGGNLLALRSLRQTIGPLYYELADLQLTAAEGQTDLRAARQSIEQFKTAELDEYFNDDCLAMFRQGQTQVDQADPSAAIVYIIPLPDRIETLLSLPDGRFERFTNRQLDATGLEQLVRTFRAQLQDPLTERYILPAKKLYDGLIEPIQPMLKSHGVATLVFVPDGSLRLIPMSALYDGERFLVERYAIAVTPGLTLMSARRLQHGPAEVLVCGMSQASGSFAALPFVQNEIQQVTDLFKTRQLQPHVLLNDQFSVERFNQTLQRNAPKIVHIASHGQFESDPSQTYLLTGDTDSRQRLSLNTLEQIVRPMQFQDQPVELLTLSACQTAMGDDRAALGLAGVALKAGARSAVASLWLVNDESAATVMHNFYDALLEPVNTSKNADYRSKAQALQTAQRRQLDHPVFGHPYYWSPFMVIGNWQ